MSDDLLGSIAELLESHVRFEEQELFPLIESNISEDELTHKHPRRSLWGSK